MSFPVYLYVDTPYPLTGDGGVRGLALASFSQCDFSWILGNVLRVILTVPCLPLERFRGHPDLPLQPGVKDHQIPVIVVFYSW